MRTLHIIGALLLATFAVGCQAPRHSQVTFQRPLSDVVAAVEKACARLEADRDSQQYWVTRPEIVAGVSYRVVVQDSFTSFPDGRTEITALRNGPLATQLCV